MSTNYRTKQPFARKRNGSANNSFYNIKLFHVAIEIILLVVLISPEAAVAASFNVNNAARMQTASALTFLAEADAYVDELQPSTNNGTSQILRVKNIENQNTESYIRFTVSGVSGTIQEARLRVYVPENSSSNGPAVYRTDNSWTETEIVWDNRPARLGGVIDNKDTIDKDTWVEYNVTSVLSGNGTYDFVLVGDSADEVRLSSREGGNAAQLVITFDSGTNTPNATSTSLPSQTPAQAFTQTATLPSGPAAGAARSNSIAAASSPLTFTPVADAYIVSGSPGTNYGSDAILHVDNSPVKHTLLRFNVSGISGQPISNAKLRLYTTEGGDKAGDFYRVTNQTWQEGTITWSNAPAAESTRLATLGTVYTNRWYEVNITPLITADGTYSLRISTTVINGAIFSSREGANPPQLVIALGGNVPTATRTPATTRTPTATQPSVSTPTRTLTATQPSAATPTRTPTRTPTAGPTSSGSVVLVGAGDIASCSRSQDEATAKLLDNIPGTVFTTGDNAYSDGTITQFNNCYDPTWGRHKSRTKPSPGNHDYHTSGAAGYFQYFGNISPYYAYDLGAWRIYSLNSEISTSSTSAQVTWLKQDLAANPRQCVLAYWHQPRWSSGSHHGNEDDVQPLWQALYNAGAELVLNGHEHAYERFAEMNATGSAVSQGLREIIVGTGGAGLYSFGTPLPASEVRNSSTYGVLKLTLRATGYDWQFVPIAGSTWTDSGSDTCR